jgi:hypothetical protein
MGWCLQHKVGTTSPHLRSCSVSKNVLRVIHTDCEYEMVEQSQWLWHPDTRCEPVQYGGMSIPIDAGEAVVNARLFWTV